MSSNGIFMAPQCFTAEVHVIPLNIHVPNTIISLVAYNTDFTSQGNFLPAIVSKLLLAREEKSERTESSIRSVGIGHFTLHRQLSDKFPVANGIPPKSESEPFSDRW